jgi:hypothetical protein
MIAIVLIILILAGLFLRSPEKPQVIYEVCPLEGYWQRGNHIMLIGINLQKKEIIISSTIGRLPITLKGHILYSCHNKITYELDGQIQDIYYNGTSIKWMGLTYTNPGLDNTNVLM